MTNTQKKIDELKKTLAELEQSLNDELMEEIFLDLINNSNYNIDGYQNIWSNTNGEWLIKQNKKTKIICFHYYRFWLKFEANFDHNIPNIEDFLISMIKIHLDLTGYTIIHFNK